MNSQSMQVRPTRTFTQFFEHVKTLGFKPDLCIDVGAANGTRAIYESFPDAFHVAFEPLPDFHEQLSQCLKSYKHRIYHCALMENDGHLEILRTEHNLYGSSLMHKRHGTDDPRLINIDARRLDDVMKNHDISGNLLLKTDCQGSDLFVVKGGINTLQHCEIVILETSFFSFWGEHHPDFTEIVQYMNDQGFVVYDILDGLFRPSDNALGQVDLVFVKRKGLFRASMKW